MVQLYRELNLPCGLESILIILFILPVEKSFQVPKNFGVLTTMENPLAVIKFSQWALIFST